MKQHILTPSQCENALSQGEKIRVTTWRAAAYIYEKDGNIYNQYDSVVANCFNEFIKNNDKYLTQDWELYKEPDVLRRVWNEYNPIEKQEQMNLYEYNHDFNILVTATDEESARELIQDVLAKYRMTLMTKVKCKGPVLNLQLIHFSTC